jgi:hypothetical protein
MRIKFRQSEISHQYRERLEEYVKYNVYREANPQFLTELLPKIYHRQLYNTLVIEGEYVGHDSDDESEDCDEPIALYVTNSIMFKIFQAEEVTIDD